MKCGIPKPQSMTIGGLVSLIAKLVLAQFSGLRGHVSLD